MPLFSISGMADLLNYCSRKSKPNQSNNNADDMYNKVLMKQLPPRNQIVFDEELKLLLMDGLVFCQSSGQYNNFKRFLSSTFAENGMRGGWSAQQI